MADKGWILIHRQIQNCVLWDSPEPFDKRSAWIDLLLSANHHDKDIFFNGEIVTIKRGQYLTSVRKLSERWSWSRDKVLKFLRTLESLQMLHKESDNHRTLLTIEKYNVYQVGTDTEQDTDSSTDKDTNQDADSSQTNNVKELNELKEKIYISSIPEKTDSHSDSFEEFWKNYPRKDNKGGAYKKYKARINSGFTPDELLEACKNYAEECKAENRDKKYIKMGQTFLSDTTPFVDYLRKGDIDGHSKSNANGYDFESITGHKISEIKYDESKPLF